MKKTLLLIVLAVQCLCTFSQNLQLHFDPRKGLHGDVADRNYFTATFEMFKPDKWGSTFMFVDLDFNQSRGNIGLAYLEIARDQQIGKLPVKAHVEFNGGIGKSNESGFSIPNAYLGGASYSYRLKNFNLGTYLVYKYNAFEKVSNDVQWTLTWSGNILNDKVTLSGFFDLWTENKDRFAGKGGKKVILLTEPQVWYNVDKHLAFGSEIEISNNFYSAYRNRVYVCPTIAGKWTF